MNIFTQTAGLNFEMGKDKLNYDKNEFPRAVDWAKTFEEAQYAFMSPISGPEILYGGARYFESFKDETVFVNDDFMSDTTFFNYGMIGDEYLKSVGHYHQCVACTEVAYPEVYEPLMDGVEYLLQTQPDDDGGVDVIWVISKASDKVMMLPGWGHVSVNTTNDVLVAVDIQKRDNPNGSDYSLFKEKVGGAVYRTKNGLIPNPNYKVKSLKIAKPKEKPEWGLEKNTPLYTSLVNNPEKFDFLKAPQNYTFAFEDFYEEIAAPFEVFTV